MAALKLTIAFVLISTITAVDDYWCKATTQDAGECFAENCPVGYEKALHARGFVGCMVESGQVHHCCVREGTTVTPPMNDVSQECGLLAKTPKILGYGAGAIGRCTWPWMVSIRSRTDVTTAAQPASLSNTLQLVSGVLIDAQWVITTAYGLSLAGQGADNNVLNNILLVAGEHNVNEQEVDEMVLTPSKYFIHPASPLSGGVRALDFQGDKTLLQGGNFALIKLATPVTYKNCVKKACLSKDLNVDNTCGGSECYIAGWGVTTNDPFPSVPYGAAVDVFNNVTCQAIAKYSGKENYIQRPYTMCAAGLSRDTRPCVGDNGGMVVCNQKGRWAVRGLITETTFDCKTDEPFVISDLGAVEDWIAETMENN